MQQQNKICNDDFDKDLYMAKTYWEPQLAVELANKCNINATITQGKVNWDLELDGQPFAELKCQKLKNVEGVWIKDKFYQNELMAAELTGLVGDRLGHFFHIPETTVKYYVIGLISKYDEKHVEYFYWFNWQLYRQNIINILRYEFGSNWYELICNNKIWAVKKKNYKIIEQTQQNGGKKWILWLHNVFDLCSMEIQQWGLLKSHVKKPEILKNIA